METNPRLRAREWAPPPPVVPGPPPIPQPPPPRATEEEFEATLGGLVEHYANLPPATYGEPPDLASDIELATRRPTDARRGHPVWATVAMVAMGGLVAGGGVAGWSYFKRQAARVAAPAPAAVPVRSVNIVVKQPAPEAAPVVEDGQQGVPQAEPLAEERVAALAIAKPVVSKTTPVKRAKRVARSARRRAPVLPAAQPAASDDGWEDPYR
jgi:hypothetical protein